MICCVNHKKKVLRYVGNKYLLKIYSMEKLLYFFVIIHAFNKNLKPETSFQNHSTPPTSFVFFFNYNAIIYMFKCNNTLTIRFLCFLPILFFHSLSLTYTNPILPIYYSYYIFLHNNNNNNYYKRL